MVNKVILLGNLGADPEVKRLDSGSVLANINLATNESFKDKSGEKQTKTEWHNITLWGAIAEVAEKYLKKGSTIYIEGKIYTEEWTDKDGNVRKTTKIRGNNLTMLGGKDKSESNTLPKDVQEQADKLTSGDDLPF